MKGMFKRALAGVAAAALAVTGLALGAGAANAAPDGQATITVNNAQDGHTYTAYKFANLVNARTEGDPAVTYVDVETVPAYVNVVKAAAEAAKSPVPAEYAKNPAAYVATFNTGELRKFADALDDSLPLAGDQGVSATVSDGKGVFEVTEGWFAVTDSFGDPAQYGPTAIVASTVKGAENLKVDTPDGQKDITAVGSFNAKSENTPDKPDKDSDKSKDPADQGQTETGTVNIGDTVNYTVTDTVPGSASGYETYTLTFKDAASKGLSINKGSIKVSVDNDDDGTFETPVTIPTENISVTGDATIGTTTTVTVPNVKAYAGKQIQLQYSATVTKDAEKVAGQGQVSNTAKVNHNGGADSEGDTVTLKYGEFSFKKVNKDGDGLKGVTFNVIKDGVNVKFESEGDGKYVVSSADTASGVLTTGTDGQLSVRGLADGTYTVKEIDNPLPGYAENFKAEFTVTVKDGVATINLDDDNNLVSENEDGQVEVLNVRSISELPLTGAAGTALFTVLGLLIAGAGTLVYMKSRSVKHMLRG